MTRRYGLKVLGLANGQRSPFDGQWLREYDPDSRGVAPGGQPMLALVRCTDDPAQAKAFESAAAAFEEWRRPSRRWPREGRLANDGKPNRPLTAFTCEVAELPHG